jgi:hypothetical protein
MRPSQRSGAESMHSCNTMRGCTEERSQGGREDNLLGLTSGRMRIDMIAHGRCPDLGIQPGLALQV